MRAWACAVLVLLVACDVPRPERPAPLPPVPPARATTTPAPPAPRLPQPRTAPAVDSRATLFGIDEGIRNDRVLAESGATWQRLVLPWSAIQPSGPHDFSRLGHTLPAELIEAQLERGVRSAGVLQFTPAWAQVDARAGERSPPRNLDRPFDDPENYWGRFTFETARYYAGRIDEWIIWNEPEFQPGEPGAGGSYTWVGTEEQYARLLEVAYRSIKAANPSARVSFAGTSYWTDELARRPQYYERVLDILTRAPDAARFGLFHDAAALNLYRTPDDIVRVHGLFKAIQQRHGIDNPLWLTETNAMPTDDLHVRCGHADDPLKTTMEQQAAFVVQGFALAAASGYTRVGFYQMIDDDPCRQPAVWGAVRDDGTRRPVADALRTAMTHLAGARGGRFVPLRRAAQPWSAWPDDPSSFVPGWEIYQVAFDLPGGRRTTVLWNGTGQPACVEINKRGASARAIDKRGAALTSPVERDGWWSIELAPATARAAEDPVGYFFIGGDPVLLIEEAVPPGASVSEPSPGCTAPPGFELSVSPSGGQTVRRGETAEFAVRTRRIRGFDAPLALRVVEWSTQRFPTPKPPESLPVRVDVSHADRVRIETAGAERGIYFLVVEAAGGGLTRRADLALVVE